MATHFSARSLFGVLAIAIAAALVSGCSGSLGYANVAITNSI